MAFVNFYVEANQAIEQLYQEDCFNEFINFIADKKFNDPLSIVNDGKEDLTKEAKDFIKKLAKRLEDVEHEQ